MTKKDKFVIKEHKTKKGLTLTFVHETSLQSIIADLITIITWLIFLSVFYLNYKYLGNSLLLQAFTIFLFSVSSVGKVNSKKKNYNDVEDLIKDIRQVIGVGKR